MALVHVPLALHLLLLLLEVDGGEHKPLLLNLHPTQLVLQVHLGSKSALEGLAHLLGLPLEEVHDLLLAEHELPLPQRVVRLVWARRRGRNDRLERRRFFRRPFAVGALLELRLGPFRVVFGGTIFVLFVILLLFLDGAHVLRDVGGLRRAHLPQLYQRVLEGLQPVRVVLRDPRPGGLGAYPLERLRRADLVRPHDVRRGQARDLGGRAEDDHTVMATVVLVRSVLALPFPRVRRRCIGHRLRGGLLGVAQGVRVFHRDFVRVPGTGHELAHEGELVVKVPIHIFEVYGEVFQDVREKGLFVLRRNDHSVDIESLHRRQVHTKTQGRDEDPPLNHLTRFSVVHGCPSLALGLAQTEEVRYKPFDPRPIGLEAYIHLVEEAPCEVDRHHALDQHEVVRGKRVHLCRAARYNHHARVVQPGALNRGNGGHQRLKVVSLHNDVLVHLFDLRDALGEGRGCNLQLGEHVVVLVRLPRIPEEHASARPDAAHPLRARR
mmetsp:Transcript_20234/g.39145  ORF Transcript_20234/g.39145 Transcript_20234/m.39145 type:complete len:494 (+) Transcript_20234:490-1971(+)